MFMARHVAVLDSRYGIHADYSPGLCYSGDGPCTRASSLPVSFGGSKHGTQKMSQSWIFKFTREQKTAIGYMWNLHL